MDDKTLEMTMLLDFYGELLTEKQRRCFELRYCDDLSLAEIAENEGVTRQAALDNVNRARAALEDAERKLGFIGKWRERRERLSGLTLLAESLRRGDTDPETADRLLAGLRALEI